MSQPASEVVRAAAWQRGMIAEELQRAEGFHQWHQKQRAEVEGQANHAQHDLAQALLPALTREHVARAVALTGYAPLSTEDVVGRMAGERASILRELGTIEADPRWIRRELLRHPRTGSLPRQLQELEGYRQPWIGFVNTCQHPRLFRLIECGWDTPAYTGSWWRLSYYSDRSAASEILGRFPSMTSFAQLRGEWDKAKDTLQKLDAEVARLRQEISAGERVEAEHARLAQALGTVEERWLAWTRDRLVRHVMSTPPGALAQRFEREPNMKVLFLRATGLAAKLVYMDGIFRDKVGKTVEDLRARDAKFAAIEARYRRKPVPMDGQKFAATFKDRRQTYHKTWQRYGSHYDRVYRFDHYDRGYMDDDLLWWDVFTGGRVDGDYIDDVARFRRQRPHYRYDPRRRDDDEIDAAAEVGTADVDGDTGGAGTSTDRS